jgi:hypothetical protein
VSRAWANVFPLLTCALQLLQESRILRRCPSLVVIFEGGVRIGVAMMSCDWSDSVGYSGTILDVRRAGFLKRIWKYSATQAYNLNHTSLNVPGSTFCRGLDCYFARAIVEGIAIFIKAV